MENETDTSDEGQDQAAMAAKIADQNDRFRRTWGADFTVPGQIVMTRGVADLSPAAKAIIMQRVQGFDVFTEDNDPYGDHGFGAFAFEIAGNSFHIFWKIDLYDTDYSMGSDDPGNPTVTMEAVAKATKTALLLTAPSLRILIRIASMNTTG